jgi:sigma-B regulation protein RsbU (phosphoserine phosphatase)
MIPIPQDVVRHSLRTELPLVGLATLVLFAGIAAIVLSRLRSRDPLLLWFGVFASLYGARLFLANGLVQFASALDERLFARAADVITYCIPIPYMLFFRRMLGPGWRGSLTLWLWVQIAFAPSALALQFVAGQPGAAHIANKILVLAGTLIAFVHLMRRAHPLALKSAIAFFLSFFVVANFGFRIGARDPEPVGSFALLCTLAFVSARSAIRREQKLTAVQQELETARRIHASILPRKLPQLRGLRIAARYEPITEVAGDFFDFIPLDERRIIVLVADVSGHGVPAALAASMLKVAFANHSARLCDPARILASLNANLGALLDQQFVTAACASVDLASHTVTYAGAGHPPALLVKAGGEVNELNENGLFLGPFRQASYNSISAPFESGDKLVLYTDGIVERADGGEAVGRERLRQFAHEWRATDPESFIGELFAAASGPPREDDRMVVVVQAE